MTTPADPHGPDIDLDPIELATEHDLYAAETHALRRQLADAREIFLNATIADLRAALADAVRANRPLALAA